jgi:hypothetical protein
MPSATTSSSVSRLYVYAIRSWLTLREPQDSWKIVKRIARRQSSRWCRCPAPRRPTPSDAQA